MAQEVKKVWALADKDGNGQVDANELKSIMTSVLKEEPSPEEISRFLELLDIDGSGTIEIKEFLKAMAVWLEEDYRQRPLDTANPAAGAGTRKRGRDGMVSFEDERRLVHKKIRGFFQQFRQQRTFADIQKELQVDSKMTTNEAARVASHRKLSVLNISRRVLQRQSKVYEALTGDSPLPYLDATKELADALSIVEEFQSPIERRSVAEVIIKLFQFLVESGIIPRLFYLLRLNNPPPGLQYHSLRALTYISMGPYMAGTPDQSPLHPRNMWFKKMLVTEGIGNLLPKYLFIQGSDPQICKIREQAVICTGAFASHNWQCRDYLLSNRILDPLLKICNRKSGVELLRHIAATISSLCGVSHHRSNQPSGAQVSPALPVLAAMMKSVHDSVIVQHCCAAMALILPTRADLPTCLRLVELLTVESSTAQIAALETITAVCSYDERQMSYMISKNMLSHVRLLIESPDINIRLSAYTLLQRIAEKGQTNAIIENDVVPIVIRQLQLNDSLRWKIMKLVKLLTRGNQQQVRFLVERGVVSALTSCLYNFKIYDGILTEMYGHVSPTFNFEFINDSLGSLQNILNIGQMEAEESGKPNRYALAFDLGSIDQISNLLRTIKECSDQLAPWRESGSGLTTEEAIKRILMKVKVAYERAGGPVAKAAVEMIAKIWHTYFLEHHSGYRSTKMLLKYQYRGVSMIDEIPLSLKFEQLRHVFRNKFGKDLQISFRDNSGEVIVVDSQLSLDQAFKVFTGQETMKLDLHDTTSETGSLTDSGSYLSGDLEELMSYGRPPAPQGTSLLTQALATRSSSLQSISSSAPAASSSSSSSSFSQQQQQPLQPHPTLPSTPPKAGTSGLGASPVLSPNSALMQSLTFNPDDLKKFDVSSDLARVKKDQKKQIFQELESSTHFGTAEIEGLFQHWVRISADGFLTKQQFAEGMRQMGLTDPLLIEQHFSAFDDDKNGRLNFREFVVGMSTAQKGSPIERLKFMFKAYDTDGSGFLTPDEVFNIFRASLLSQGQSLDPAKLSTMVHTAFSKIDADGDGKLSFNEFAQAVQSGILKLPLAKASAPSLLSRSS
ncbi:MAG: EF-hand domain-containing protein [archaeon]|nr:EF-hand domain-containing protein [archaeon]